MPQRFKEYGAAWSGFNKPHEVIDWTEEMIFDQKWENQRVIDNMISQSKYGNADKIAYYTHMADVIDYELCYRYGGWYVNCDLKPLKSLQELEYSKSHPAFAYEDDVHLVNMAMYAPAGDLLFENIIETLPKRYWNMFGQGMHITTGVGLIMEALAGYTGPVTKFHRDVFNPLHWRDIEQGRIPDLNRDYPDNTIAVHEWNHRETGRGAEILR